MSFKLKIIKKIAKLYEKLGRKSVIYDRETSEPYLERYYLLFKNRPNWFPFNIVLHRFIKSDNPSCGLHDHPWNWKTCILTGGYWENMLNESVWRTSKDGFRSQKAEFYHRIILDNEKLINDNLEQEIWTLFIMGKRRKPWGFLNKNNEWVFYKDYLKQRENDPTYY